MDSAYQKSPGSENPPAASLTAFRCLAEVIAAVGDPRYDTDPAYRAECEKRLEMCDVAV